jgi:hypothetical protein
VGLGEGHARRGASCVEGARVRVQGTEAREAAEQEHGSRLEKLAMENLSADGLQMAFGHVSMVVCHLHGQFVLLIFLCQLGNSQMCTHCTKACLLPNHKLRSFKVKDTLGRMLHFGPEKNAL